MISTGAEPQTRVENMKGDVTELLSMISTMLEEGIQPGYHSPLHMCPLAWRVTEEDEKVKAEKIIRAVT